MQQKPAKFLFSVPSDSWRSTLEFKLSERFGKLRIRHSSDLVECLQQTQEFQPELVIVELRKESLVAECKTIFTAGQRSPNTQWVAVSHDDLTRWQRLLWVCGVADLCSNISRVELLISRIGSYLDPSRTPAPGFIQSQTIEERIIQSMPW